MDRTAEVVRRPLIKQEVAPTAGEGNNLPGGSFRALPVESYEYVDDSAVALSLVPKLDPITSVVMTDGVL